MNRCGFYAGVGARATPDQFLGLMTRVAEYLQGQGFKLRSGGANGADAAFAHGHSPSTRQLFLPWPGFNGINSGMGVWVTGDDPGTVDFASRLHDRWGYMSGGVRKLMARNVSIIMGKNLIDPVRFVLCWTPEGAGQGGTGFALKIARHAGIPCFDMGRYATTAACREPLFDFLGEFMR
ncbi:hypothetical protein [Sinimarinibacterium sp. NLF-5-8]|uniref:hypothetical protein n=1 Tax=Sinimarinibacterium sp. NLF-5-8 TaxID=2698684 RepID=UPI00345F5D20